MFRMLVSFTFIAVLAAAAQAGTITMDLRSGATGISATEIGSGQGNKWRYEIAGESVYAEVTGWWMTSHTSLTRSDGRVGRWSGGIGVINDQEPTSSNEHTVDNLYEFDFLEFRFFRWFFAY